MADDDVFEEEDFFLGVGLRDDADEDPESDDDESDPELLELESEEELEPLDDPSLLVELLEVSLVDEYFRLRCLRLDDVDFLEERRSLSSSELSSS